MVKKSIKSEFSKEEIDSFEKYYRMSVIKYLQQNNLCIKRKYDHSDNEFIIGHYTSPSSCSNTTYYSSYHNHNNIYTIGSNGVATLNNIVTTDYYGTNIHWDIHANPFFRFFYSNADELVKNILQNNKFILYGLDDFSLSLSNDIELTIDYIKKSKHLYASVFSQSYLLKNIIDTWKKIFNPEQFNNIIIDFFTYHKNEGKKTKSKINIEYILDNFIDDKNVYQHLLSLFPPREKIKDPFGNSELTIFEIYIDRKKLIDYIKLPENDDYNRMHNIVIEILNDNNIGGKIGLYSVETSSKYKLLKQIPILVKLEKNSSYDIDKFKNLIMAIYKGYELISKNNKYYLIKDMMTLSWVNAQMLNHTLSIKEKNVNKTMKI